MKGKIAIVWIVRVVLLMVLLLAAVTPAFAQDPGPGGGGGGSGGGRGGEIVGAFRKIAVWVIDVLIALSAILMAVGLATGLVGGQFMVMTGNALGLSTAWCKVIFVIILGVCAMLVMLLVNAVIGVVAPLIPPTEIPSV